MARARPPWHPGCSFPTGVSPSGQSPCEVRAAAGRGRASHAWHPRKLPCKSALGVSSKYFLCEQMQISLWGSPLSGLVLHQPEFLPVVEHELRKGFPKKVMSVCSYTPCKAAPAKPKLPLLFSPIPKKSGR